MQGIKKESEPSGGAATSLTGLAEGVNPPPELDLAKRGWTCCAYSSAAKGHPNHPYRENQCSVA